MRGEDDDDLTGLLENYMVIELLGELDYLGSGDLFDDLDFD